MEGVIEQQGVGVSLAGKLKGLGNELVAAELVVTALTIGVGLLSGTSETAKTTKAATVGDGLVHHIPAIDDILITVDDGVDVVAQTFVEHFLLHFLTFFIGKHPVGKL